MGLLRRRSIIRILDAAAATINAWVSDQTHGKIQNLISAAAITTYTRLILTNAIYFQGNWATAFKASLTQDASFETSPGESSSVQMMQQVNELGYYQQLGADGFQAVDLPYSGNNLDMMVILPTSSDLASFQSGMNADLFSTISSNLATSDVDVQLPKFQINETYDLVPSLQDLGIHEAFTGAADLSGISSQGPLAISQVIQKSQINVDETGTEAAAATGVAVSTAVATVSNPSPPISFDANHPFLFAIRDRATNTILFMGSVANPGGSRSPDPSNGSGAPSPAPANGGGTPLSATPLQPFPLRWVAFPSVAPAVSEPHTATKKSGPSVSGHAVTGKGGNVKVATIQKGITSHNSGTIKKSSAQPLVALTLSADHDWLV